MRNFRLFLLLVSIISCNSLFAQPSNDDCANAILLNVGSECTAAEHTSIGGTTEDESIAPNPTCGFFQGSDVWFAFNVPASGDFRIQLTSQWQLYSGTCGAFTEIWCDSGNQNFRDPSLAGQTLYIRSFRFNSAAGQNFSVCVWEPQMQPNDYCADAIDISVGQECNPQSFSSIYSTGESTVVAPDPTCNFYKKADVWFTFTVPASGDFRIELNSSWELYTGACGNFEAIWCDSGNQNFRDLSLAGQTLYLRSFRFNSEEGQDFDLCIWEPEMQPNDHCADAIDIAVGQECSPQPFSSQYSTGESTDVAPDPTCNFYKKADVWFTFTVPASGDFRIELNSSWELYTGSCGNFEAIWCDSGNQNFRELSLAGQTLYLRSFRFNSEEGQDFDLCIWEPEMQPNDHCADAIDIAVGQSCTAQPFSSKYSTGESTDVAPEPTCGFYKNADVWFTFTVPASGNFRIEMNSQWELYSGVCGAFLQIECNSGNMNYSDPALAGDVLYLRAFRFNSEEGADFTLCIWEIDVPENNLCENATNIILNDSCNSQSYTSRYSTAEQNTIAPNPSCGFYQGGDVWFTFTAPESGQFALNRTSGGSQFAFYTGSCGDFEEFDCSGAAEINFNDPSLGGQEIFVRAYAFNSRQGTDFEFCIKNTTIAENDNCANAISLNAGESCTFETYNNFNTTNEEGVAPPPTCGFYQGGDVWFTFEVPSTGQFQINRNNISGGSFNYAIYTGDCGNFELYDCSIDPAQSIYDATELANQTVYLRVYRWNSAFGGEFELCIVAGDCSGELGGTSYVDECGTCVGGNTGLEPCIQDCNDVYGGTAFIDNCETCVGGNTGIEACTADCNGDFGGTAYLDNCETCVGGNTGLEACIADCNGDFGGTAYFDNCEMCVEGNTGLEPCVADCNGDFGGTAYLDNCETCVDGNTGLEACAADCNGDFGGTAFFDNCETCVEGNTGLEACAADCNGDFGGTAYFDNCETCVGGDTGLDACVQDCDGIYGGTAYLDNCETCVGGDTGLDPCVQDCNNVYGGTAYIDNCETCVGGDTGLEECVQDCDGIYGGTAYLDNCETCVGGNTGLEACVADCNEDFGGTAYLDNCETCVGGNTGLEECEVDCNGDFGGTAYLDNCETCVEGNTGLEACAADCNGDFGGTAFFDNCETCVEGNTGLEACTADCNGDFGGTAYLDNCETCVEGNTGLEACTADCNGDFGGTAYLDNCETCVDGNTGLEACIADCNGDFGGTAYPDNCETCVEGNTGLEACTADCNGDFGGTAYLDNCETCVEGNTGLEACTADCNGDFGGTAYLDNCETCVDGNTGLEACIADCNGDFGGTAYPDNCETCVEGNTGLEACTADCNGDFGGTAYLDNCETCVEGNTGLEACVQDCNGDFGGTAYLDNCETCVEGNTGLEACIEDCNGDFGGTAYLDNCETCVEGNTGLEACAADCNGDFGGTAYLDNCETCVEGNTGLEACTADCNGDFGGTAYLDNCETCVEGNTGLEACVADCNGDFGGTAYLDNCETCVEGNTGLEACAADCNGDFGGTAYLDNCETCVEGNTGLEACVADCNGDFGGTAYLDNCETCVEGNTGLEACEVDCNGDFGGTAYLDNCETCVEGNTGIEACTADCNGDFGGTAYLDNCETCVEGNTGLEACIADCNGDFGGTAFFDNCETCVEGNTGLEACATDCNGDFGGTAYLDNCETCVDGNTGLEACAADCNGDFGGTASLDDCEICTGGNTGLAPCNYDCPTLEANIGDSCDDENPDTENEIVTEDCGCEGEPIAPSDCENFVYYLADFISGEGTTIYEVTLNDGHAELQYLTQIDIEVQLAYSNENNLVYAISKTGNSYFTLNPHVAQPTLSGPVFLEGNIGQITGAAFSAEGDLLIASQSLDIIFSIDISDNSLSVFDAYAPIRGGDIATDAAGNIFLTLNSGSDSELYEVSPQNISDDVFLSGLTGNNTGAAITADDEILLSGNGKTYLTLVSTNGADLGQYELFLNGNIFTLGYGDMTSGCNTFVEPEPTPCESFRTFYAQKDISINETTIYEVNFSGSSAILTALTSVADEVHIGYDPENGVIHMVSKSGSYTQQYDVNSNVMNPQVFFDQQVHSITGTDYSSGHGLIYIADDITNMIYSLNPVTGEVNNYVAADISGGDITVTEDETIFLATQSGNALREIRPDLSTTFIGGIPSRVTGMAQSTNNESLLISNFKSNVFVEVNSNNASPIFAYKAILNDAPFTLLYGDMASGCANNEVNQRRPKTINTNLPNLHSQEVKTQLSSQPNPTSGSSEVMFVPARTGKTLVKVYDMTGRTVATLFDQIAEEGLTYRINFDGNDLPSGVYIYRLTNQNETVMDKFLITK